MPLRAHAHAPEVGAVDARRRKTRVRAHRRAVAVRERGDARRAQHDGHSCESPHARRGESFGDSFDARDATRASRRLRHRGDRDARAQAQRRIHRVHEPFLFVRDEGEEGDEYRERRVRDEESSEMFAGRARNRRGERRGERRRRRGDVERVEQIFRVKRRRFDAVQLASAASDDVIFEKVERREGWAAVEVRVDGGGEEERDDERTEDELDGARETPRANGGDAVRERGEAGEGPTPHDGEDARGATDAVAAREGGGGSDGEEVHGECAREERGAGGEHAGGSREERGEDAAGDGAERGGLRA